MTREELIALCDASVVPQDKWDDRDTEAAQRQVGELRSLVLAGCDYKVDTDIAYGAFNITVSYRGFQWFENCTEDDPKEESDAYLDKIKFYLPTREKLNKAGGEDWY